MTQRKFGSMRELSQELLHGMLDYSPVTGNFRWSNPAKNAHVKRGDLAGGVRRGTRGGYWYISVLNRQRPAHILAWLYCYGVLPDGPLDHINGDRLDNRIENLRVVTKEQNQHNRKLNTNSGTGVKGVTRRNDTGRYQGKVMFMGKSYSAGVYTNLKDAEMAVKQLRAKLHGDYARDA